MTVWVVGYGDCENTITSCICATKEIAIREIFKVRDRLVEDWKGMEKYSQESIAEFCKKENKEIWVDNSYRDMINNVSSDDYTTWKNYPHYCPYMYEIGVIES